MENMFGIACFLWLTCQTELAVGYAQESRNAAPVDTAQDELGYFLGQQDLIKAAGMKLQFQLDELQIKYAADPATDLREQIREHEEFVTKLLNLRGEAPRFLNAALLPSVDWCVQDAQDSANKLNNELNLRLRAPNPDRDALKGQIDKLQKDIDLNNKLAKVLADKIKSIQDDHRREGVASELDALAGSGARSGPSPKTAFPGTEKEH